jgi:succinate-semialdehyde dehydrogenase/glutarate-semialdehyde dehydrogenase
MLSINPFTEQQLAAYPEASAADVERSLGQASDAFRAWRGASLAERGARMAAAGAALRQRRDALAALITAEMGKPLSQAAAEVDKCAWVCEFYAQRAEQFLAPECVPTEAAASYVRYDPLGPVLAVMPWNFPLWQAFRFAAPTLMAGNVGLLKHASNVQGCALAIQEVFSAAGFPAGAFTTLVVGSA